MKLLRMVQYCIRSALLSFKHAWSLHAIAVATVALSFLVFGAAVLAYWNVRMILIEPRGGARISVYLREGVSESEAQEVKEKYYGRSVIQACAYVSSDDARKEFLRREPELDRAVRSLPQNPFPSSIQVEISPGLRDASVLSGLTREIAAESKVEAVNDGGIWARKYIRFLRIFDWCIMALGLSLGAVLTFVVMNTIRLVVYSRRDEVEILSLVGATEGLIRVPFLLEGFLHGLLGAGISLFLLLGLRRLFEGQLGLLLEVETAPRLFALPGVAWIGLLSFGGMVGIVGSTLAVRKFLR